MALRNIARHFLSPFFHLQGLYRELEYESERRQYSILPPLFLIAEGLNVMQLAMQGEQRFHAL